MNNKASNTKAFSLIEVLIFTTVFSLFFVLASTVVTTTLRITKENQNKIRATHYVEELKEWLQTEKEINWGGTAYSGSAITNFTEYATQAYPPPYNTLPIPDTDYCFNTAPVTAWPARGASNCNLMLDNQFRRIATFSASSIEGGYIKQISADISVEWNEGKIIYKVPLKVVFSVWE